MKTLLDTRKGNVTGSHTPIPAIPINSADDGCGNNPSCNCFFNHMWNDNTPLTEK